MFIDRTHNLGTAVRFWEGKPSKGLLWCENLAWLHVERDARAAGYEDPVEYAINYAQDELGCLVWARIVQPAEAFNPFVEVTKTTTGQGELVEYRSAVGTLRELRQDGQIVKHKVETIEDLGILVEMWRHMEVRSVPKPFGGCPPDVEDRIPMAIAPSHQSAIQRFLQYETGVANFWYLLQDVTVLMEEAMELWQAMLEKQYRMMESLDVPRYYQAENTSTTMISPEYYEKYSLGHIRQLTASARRCGARTLIHMCGLLRDLMPLLRRTGMNGIHSLTPPTVGNTEFGLAFETMPKDFMVLGRFGAFEWIGKTRGQIVSNLRRLLPHSTYREQPFVLLVDAALERYRRADIERVRDAIEEFERVGG